MGVATYAGVDNVPDDGSREPVSFALSMSLGFYDLRI